MVIVASVALAVADIAAVHTAVAAELDQKDNRQVFDQDFAEGLAALAAEKDIRDSYVPYYTYALLRCKGWKIYSVYAS